MQPQLSFQQVPFSQAPQHTIEDLVLDFENSEWKVQLQTMINALSEHKIYKDHLEKIQRENHINEAEQQEQTKTKNYNLTRKVEYKKQLEEFNKARDKLHQKLQDLSPTDITQGKKIYDAVKLELRRLKEAVPIYANKSEIIEAIRANPVIFVSGNTGSGKSTQLMQYLLEIEEFDKKIALGQPYKHSLEPLVKRIQEESNVEIALLPDYSNRLVSDAKLEVHTHGSLINALIDDHNLTQYSCVIIDEAHERFIESDVLLSLSKELLERKPEVKLIITSATADIALFDRLYKKIPIIEVAGISYKVEPLHVGSFQENEGRVDDLIRYIMKQGIQERISGVPTYFDGNILIFAPTRKEISSLTKSLQEICKDYYEILPYHGDLAEDSKRKVFMEFGKPKLIISTRIGETSITIRDLKVVIDTGYDILRRFDRKTHTTNEKRGSISKSASKQRFGRVGRTCPGLCIRLYSEDDFKELDDYEKSSLKSYHFYRTIINLKSMGVSNLLEFDFLEELDEEDKHDILADQYFMHCLDALDSNMQITPLGRIMGECNLETIFTRILFEGVKLDCVEEVSKALTLYSKDWKLFPKKYDALKKKMAFCDKDGDFIMLLKVFNQYLELEGNPDALEAWIKENFINIDCLKMAKSRLLGLKDIIQKMKNLNFKKHPFASRQPLNERILQCVFRGFWYNICHFERNSYQFCRLSTPMSIDKKSSIGLVGSKPDTRFLICNEITSSEGVFTARVFSRVNVEWIRELPSECQQIVMIDQVLKKYQHQLQYQPQQQFESKSQQGSGWRNTSTPNNTDSSRSKPVFLNSKKISN